MEPSPTHKRGSTRSGVDELDTDGITLDDAGDDLVLPCESGVDGGSGGCAAEGGSRGSETETSTTTLGTFIESVLMCAPAQAWRSTDGSASGGTSGCTPYPSCTFDTRYIFNTFGKNSALGAAFTAPKLVEAIDQQYFAGGAHYDPNTIPL